MSNLKHIPTAKLQEILDESYCRGSAGHDYEPAKEELQKILWERLARVEEKENERLIEEIYG